VFRFACGSADAGAYRSWPGSHIAT
jgi:hypothetical protein